ncbi:hypothetical protein [Nocardioides zeicaulis]|uniref:Thrombospondin n=1 Tax=Nocardioides zeicaulis TaxID=1776857 RepID=A0ABV6E3V3_9ACTN
MSDATTRGRLLLLLLVALAATLLPVPVATAATPSARAGCSADAACRTDSDGDGLDDALDGCPAAASTNPTGCPSAERRARLRWREGAGRLEARITSPVDACAARARIKLWRVRAGADLRVDSENAAASGRRRFRVARGARYYVTVSPSYASGQAECLKAASRTVRVPRR